LREMILAGGALAATACGPSTVTPTNAGADATSSAGDDAGLADTKVCCNANPDPCCALMCDPEPNVAAITACEENRMKCGVNERYGDQANGAMGCVSLEQPEAGCCNANPDPCCPMGYCGGDAGPDSSVYIDCEQGRSECEALDASYGSLGDGSIGCRVLLGAGDAGPPDARPGDAGPGDAEAGP
jgi:hypothetical protein